MYEFGVIFLAHSYSGLVLSRRAVEFSLEPCCPEVPWSSVALTFSVSRGRCGIIASMRFVSSFLLLKSGRFVGFRVFVWIVSLRGLRCPEVGVGIPNLTSGHRERDLRARAGTFFCTKQPRGRHAATWMRIEGRRKRLKSSQLLGGCT